MNYHPDDFLRLMEAVESEGGAHLPDAHLPDEFQIKLPVPGAQHRMAWRTMHTSGCGREARFVVTYEPATANTLDREEQHKRGAGYATVCAVDDDIGKWPRFAAVMQEDSF